jgi:hypothetical protein
MSLTPSRLRAVFCTALLGSAALLLGLSASAAQAGPLVDQAVSCDSYVFEQPFVRWENPLVFNYVLAPDGGFERRARGWQLIGGARSVHGNESYYVNRRTDSHSLFLPAGSSAVSPAMCAGVDYPTLRMFSRKKGSAPLGLDVEMLYENPLIPDVVQSVHLLPALTYSESRWAPTLPMVLPTGFTLPATLSGNTAAIAFRFTPLDDASSWIDDVYVDPYRRY